MTSRNRRLHTPRCLLGGGHLYGGSWVLVQWKIPGGEAFQVGHPPIQKSMLT